MKTTVKNLLFFSVHEIKPLIQHLVVSNVFIKSVAVVSRGGEASSSGYGKESLTTMSKEKHLKDANFTAGISAISLYIAYFKLVELN